MNCAQPSCGKRAVLQPEVHIPTPDLGGPMVCRHRFGFCSDHALALTVDRVFGPGMKAYAEEMAALVGVTPEYHRARLNLRLMGETV